MTAKQEADSRLREIVKQAESLTDLARRAQEAVSRLTAPPPHEGTQQ